MGKAVGINRAGGLGEKKNRKGPFKNRIQLATSEELASLLGYGILQI